MREASRAIIGTLHARRLAFVAAIVILTLTVLVLTWNQVELYVTFYGYQAKPMGSAAVNGLLGTCFCVLLVLARRDRIPTATFLVSGILVGTAMQFGFAYTEGRGFDGLRSRALAGHGQFIADALATRNPIRTLREYDTLAKSGKLGSFPQSKPPGTLGFYMLTVAASELVVPHTYDEDLRKNRFVDFLAVTWPFVAAAAILPLYWLTTMMAGPDEARLASALYLLVPSFNLVTLHTDQVLFPSLYLVVLALFVLALRQTSSRAVALGGAATGVALCVAVYCDFPLATVIVFCAGLWLATFAADRRAFAVQARSSAVLAGAATIGVLAPSMVLWRVLSYDPIARWRAALAFHAAWRHVPAVVAPRDGFSNIAEFIDWTGIPIVMLAVAVFFVRVPDTAADTPRRWLQPALMLSLGCLVGYLAFLSHTAAETARLWLFLTPMVCLVAAHVLAEFRRTMPWAVAVVFALQIATVYVIKITHDFW